MERIQQRQQLIKLLLKSQPLSISISTIAAVLTALTLWGGDKNTEIIYWISVFLMISTARLVAVRYFQSENTICNAPELVEKWITTGILASAITWGAGTWSLFPLDDYDSQMILTFVVGGIAAASITTLSYVLVPTIVFQLALILPLASRFFASTHPLSNFMAYVQLLYIFGLSLASYAINKNVTASIELKIKNHRKSKLLEYRELQIDTLINVLPNVVVIVDAEGKIVFSEGSSLDRFFQEEGQLVGKNIFDYFQDCQELTYGIRHALHGEPTQYLVKTNERVYSAFSRPVMDETGNVKRVVNVATDITDQVALETDRDSLQARLGQAQKMEALGHLAGGIAHDFNNILTSVLGFSRLVLTDAQKYKDEELIDNAREIIKAGSRATDLVSKISKFGRADSRKVNQVIDVQEVIQESIELLAPLIPKSIEIVLRSTESISSTKFDPVELQQCIMNICINACDAIANRGEILIDIRIVNINDLQCNSCGEKIEGTYLEIGIKDTGSGIGAEHISSIFDPFFTTKEAGRGTGMGLSVAHGLVHNQQGHIVVESTRGVGTNFRILLPPADSSIQPVRLSGQSVYASPNENGKTRSGRILVVDDERAVGLYLIKLLKRHGFEVVYYENPLQALQILREQETPFDLLLTDHAMPQMSGIDLIGEVKSVCPELPSLLCSGKESWIFANNKNQEMLSQFVPKPVDPDYLIKKIDQYIL